MVKRWLQDLTFTRFVRLVILGAASFFIGFTIYAMQPHVWNETVYIRSEGKLMGFQPFENAFELDIYTYVQLLQPGGQPMTQVIISTDDSGKWYTDALPGEIISLRVEVDDDGALFYMRSSGLPPDQQYLFDQKSKVLSVVPYSAEDSAPGETV